MSNSQVVIASTSLKISTSYLRGDILMHPTTFTPLPDHVIAHELAHIFLNSRDEIVADNKAMLWIRGRGLDDKPAYGDLRAGHLIVKR